MQINDFVIEPRRLWSGEALWDGPLAVIDLDAAGDARDPIALPPCPVLGIGDRHHPLAARLDAVAEPGFSAERLMRGVLRAPRAAAVTVQLLRLLPALSVEQGLDAESLAYGVLQGSAEHRAWRERRPAGPDSGDGAVRLEREDDRLLVTLDKPATDNAIDRAMRDALHEAFALAALDRSIARISLRGAGRSFSLGAELSEFGTTTDPATAHAIRGLTLPARMAWRCADRLDVHVQGACVGAGLELAAWAHRITAARRAWFQLPELAMGILPGAGGCVALSRRIGPQRTALLILSGKRLGARQALDWGLVDELA